MYLNVVSKISLCPFCKVHSPFSVRDTRVNCMNFEAKKVQYVLDAKYYGYEFLNIQKLNSRLTEVKH